MISQLKSSPDRLFLGAKFAMHMKDFGVPYVTNNVVVDFVENKSIAWHHFSQFVWRYDLNEVDDVTTVTESFDYSPPWGVFIIPLGFPKRNEVAIRKSLEQLEKAVTS